jgi:hypothetical protein
MTEASSITNYHAWHRSKHLLKVLDELGCDFPILEATFNASPTLRSIKLGSPVLMDSVEGGRCMPVWLMLSDPREWKTSWEDPWRSSMNEVLIELKARVIGFAGEYEVEKGPLEDIHLRIISSLVDDIEGEWMCRNPTPSYYRETIY